MRAFQRLVERHVVEEDIGRFAAQLQRNGNHQVGRSLCNATAHLGRAGKGELVEALVVQHVFAGFGTFAGNDVEHAFGQQVVDFLCQRQQTQRRAAGRMDDNGAARSQRGCDLPGRHQEGEIPGNDLPHHANGLAQDQRQVFFIQLCGRAFFTANHAGEVAKMIGGKRNVGGTGFANGLAVVERFLQGKEFEVGVDDVGNFVQQCGTLGCGGFFPGFEGFLRGLDGCIHIGIGGVHELCQFCAIGRVVRSEQFALAALGPFTIDQQAIFLVEYVQILGHSASPLKINARHTQRAHSFYEHINNVSAAL